MRYAQDHYPDCPEAMMVKLAQGGDRGAFAELVRRRQSSIRSLMRRCCHDPALADDLAQQVFLQVWRKIHTVRKADAFGPWLKRIAITTWLLHARKKDALLDADEITEDERSHTHSNNLSVDLDRALSTLPVPVRSCVVLSYQEGMSHTEISKVLEMPLGTVKSHIARGGKQLRKRLSAYDERPETEEL